MELDIKAKATGDEYVDDKYSTPEKYHEDNIKNILEDNGYQVDHISVKGES